MGPCRPIVFCVIGEPCWPHTCSRTRSCHVADTGGRQSSSEWRELTWDAAVRSPLQEVTSLSFAAYGEDGKGMLVTGAHDGLSRLWTLDGCLIGTFGVDLWQCDNPTTFVDEEADYRLQPDDEYAADPRTAVPEGQEVRAPVRLRSWSNNAVTHFFAATPSASAARRGSKVLTCARAAGFVVG